LTLLGLKVRISTMSYEAERLTLRLWLDRAASYWEAFQARLPSLSRRWLILLAVGGLAAYAFFLRCVHLLSQNHYYLIRFDSYFFHWVAGKVMAGEPPTSAPWKEDTYILHSGLAYPLAYIAKAISSVFNMPSADALDLASKFLPPLLGIISMLVIYLAAAKIYNRRVGLLSSFAWGAVLHAVMHGGAAGHIDRDVLSILLLMIGALLFYFSRGWQFRIGKRDIGWLLAGLGVLGVEGLLYLEWGFIGPALLLIVLAVYFVVRFLLGYTDRLQTEPSPVRRLTAAISEFNWRTFALIIGINIVVAAGLHSQAASWYDLTMDIFRSGGRSNIDEMQGVWARGFADFINYHFFLIPMAVGLYVAWKRRDEGSIFFSCWFLCLVAASMYSSRILIHAAPAACLLSGVGLAFLWDWGGWSGFKPLLKRFAVVTMLGLMIIFSFVISYNLGSSPRMAVHEDWQDALTYLRDKTPEDAVIMTWWDYGYWILDLAQRRPVVDNGYYGWDSKRLYYIKKAYLSTENSEAVQMMEKYGADYLIFSELDLDAAPTILAWPSRPQPTDGEYEEFPEDSLVVRSLNGEFESGGGLEVVYRSAPNSEVVILKLTQSEQP